MMSAETKSMVLHAATAIAGGVVSYYAQRSAGLPAALLAGAALLLASGYAARVLVKEKKSAKWWASNGAVAYLFIWLIVWTVLYNMKAVG